MPDLGSVALNCAQTPLHFPPDISLNLLTVTTTSGINITATSPGSLQILSRRLGQGLGDGVNIVENSGIKATYRGQTYFYNEAIMHFPGLHKFPGKNDVYPGEYHIHLSTAMEPARDLTLIIPMIQASSNGPGHPYFDACTGTGTSGNTLTLANLIPFGSDVIQYQGPDLRNRTYDTPTNASCTNLIYDYQFLLVLTPVPITPANISKIFSCGNVYHDPRDQPKQGVRPTQTSIPRTKILAQVVLARPGIIDPNPTAPSTPACVVPSPPPDPTSPEPDNTDDNGINIIPYVNGILCALGIFIGVLIIDFISGFFWSHLFTGDAVKAWIPMKAILIMACVITAIFWYRGFLNYWGIS